MAVRFRKSFRLGGVKLNVTKNGLSSISLGGRGASLNIPVARSGGIRGTVGIPGSGLSYSKDFKSFSASHAGSPDPQNIDFVDNAEIADLVSDLAAQEADLAAMNVYTNELLDSPEYKSAQEILNSSEVRSAQEIKFAQNYMESYESLKLSSSVTHSALERAKEGLEILKSQSNRRSKLQAANIENRKMIGPIFAALGGTLLLLFVVGAIGASFSTTEPGGSTPQIEAVDPSAPNGIPGDCSGNRWMSRGCTSGTPGN